MSNKSSDKQTYSVDEMMDRLRDDDREKRDEGELVTREDGSQVLRVKKRKRRSTQKKEVEAKRRKRYSLVRTLALIAIPVVLGLSVVYLLAKYHSSGFSEDVAATVWDKTGGRAKIASLSPKGTTISTNSIQLNWPDGSYLDNLKATQISGDLNPLSFVTGRFKGTELNSKKGFLLLSGREERKVRPPAGAPLAMPGFQQYASDYFSFFFGKQNSAFRLEDSRVKFTSSDYSHQLALTGGELVAGSWGTVPLQRGTLEFLNETIRIVSLRFEEEERHLIFSGDLGLKDDIHSLSVEVVKGTVGNVAGYGLEEFFEAEIPEATGTLVFSPWTLKGHELTISAAPKYVKVVKFPFLDVLQGLYGDSRFQGFEFELENPFEVIRGNEGAEIRGIDFSEFGIFAMKGNIRITGERLSGVLEVGLPDHRQLTISSEERKSFFSRGKLEDGYFWYRVELGGTKDAPTDNFFELLKSGRKESVEDLFEKLTE